MKKADRYFQTIGAWITKKAGSFETDRLKMFDYFQTIGEMGEQKKAYFFAQSAMNCSIFGFHRGSSPVKGQKYPFYIYGSVQ